MQLSGSGEVDPLDRAARFPQIPASTLTPFRVNLAFWNLAMNSLLTQAAGLPGTISLTTLAQLMASKKMRPFPDEDYVALHGMLEQMVRDKALTVSARPIEGFELGCWLEFRPYDNPDPRLSTSHIHRVSGQTGEWVTRRGSNMPAGAKRIPLTGNHPPDVSAKDFSRCLGNWRSEFDAEGPLSRAVVLWLSAHGFGVAGVPVAGASVMTQAGVLLHGVELAKTGQQGAVVAEAGEASRPRSYSSSDLEPLYVFENMATDKVSNFRHSFELVKSEAEKLGVSIVDVDGLFLPDEIVKVASGLMKELNFRKATPSEKAAVLAKRTETKLSRKAKTAGVGS